MSDRFTAVVTALSEDPELQEKVLAAETPEERAALLSAAGIELPTPEEVEAAKLSGVAGGYESPTAVDCAVVGVSTAGVASAT